MEKEWREVKQKGNPLYKGRGVEPIDLIKEGEMLRDFALGSIIKYSYRNRRAIEKPINQRDVDKIIHYAEMLKISEKGEKR